MKRFKKIMSAAIAAIMCVAISAPAFATSTEGTEASTETKTYTHKSNWLAEDTKEVNKAYKLIDNVYEHAMPTLATAGDTSMVLYTDVDKVIVSTSSSATDDGTTSGTSSASSFYTEASYKYAVRDNKTGKWLNGGAIPASSEKYMVTEAGVYTDHNDIYVVVTESDNSLADNMDSMGDISSIMSLLNDFKMRISVLKYDATKNTFTEAVPAISEKSKFYLMPKLIFNNDTMTVSYVAITMPSLSEILQMLPDLMKEGEDSAGIDSIDIDSSLYSSTFNKKSSTWSTPKVICKTAMNAFGDYIPGIINDKPVFAVVVPDAKDAAKDAIKFYDENGKLIHTRIGAFQNLLFNRFADSKTDCFYFCDNDGKLIRLDVDSAGKLQETVVLSDIPATWDICKTNTGIAYISDGYTLVSRVFDTKTNTYAAPYEVAKFNGLVYKLDINIINENNLIIAQENPDAIINSNNPEDRFCGAVISYILYDGKTDDTNVVPSFEKPIAPKPVTPAEEPTKPTNTTKKPTASSTTATTKKPANVDNKIPNTGSTSVGIAAFALLGISAACVVALKKKKAD